MLPFRRGGYPGADGLYPPAYLGHSPPVSGNCKTIAGMYFITVCIKDRQRLLGEIIKGTDGER